MSDMEMRRQFEVPVWDGVQRWLGCHALSWPPLHLPWNRAQWPHSCCNQQYTSISPAPHGRTWQPGEEGWLHSSEEWRGHRVIECSNTTWCFQITMSDVQNFFHIAPAVIFAKVWYLYFRRKLSASFIECYHCPVAHSMYAEVTLLFNFSRTNFHWTRMLRLYCTDL